jgi:4-amino-4-deoxy-L-arabinose transferase-like glycosyltransferase
MSLIELEDPAVRAETPAPTPPTTRRRSWSLLTSRPGDPRWARPALLTLLAGTAILYLWGLGASGWANSFYSAAAQAGSQSWKALFFGSSDAANFITVDKPPASLWVMGLSVRLFGLNAWSILVPEALMGVATVAVLYATIKRWFGAAAGLLAGAVLALMPVAALMFRFNNPDALLVLVLVAAAYCVTRALEAASTRWLMLAYGLVGLGFLTKMLQALLVVPAFGLVYLIAAPTQLRRRLWQSIVAVLTFVVAAGWWVAIVELVPASWRPYVGGSQNNSVLNLIFGYNGFGRITGNETGSVGGVGGAGGQWGPTGWLRLFNTDFGNQSSWLIPAALCLLFTGLVLTWRAPRIDRTRAALVLWGGWLLVTGATFSLSQGIIHPYYTVALAPAIGALVGIGAVTAWKRRHEIVARVGLIASVAVSAWWAVTLLDRTPSWNPWLRPLIMVAAVVAVAGLLLPRRAARWLAIVTVAAGLVAGVAAPALSSVATALTAHSGAIPSVTPSAGGFGPGGGGGRGPDGFAGGPGGGVGNGAAPAFGAGNGNAAPAFGGNGGTTAGGFGGGGTGGPQRGGAGGLLNGSTSNAQLTTLLRTDADKYTWVAASVGANSAAGYQLASGDPVMAIGGFNGSDPWPTLAVFEQYVSEGKIHYFIGGGGFGGGAGGNSSTSSAISSWVTSHFTATTVGGVTVYDLTRPATS